MRKIIYWVSALVIGVAIGLKAFTQASSWNNADRGLNNGVWTTNTAYGDVNADALTKAAVAVSGLLALKASETIYFNTHLDSSGEPLSDLCEYAIEGTTPDARWSSITLYGEDHFLIPNAWNRYSVFLPEAGDPFTFKITPEGAGDAHILAGAGGRNLALTLRIYNPSKTVYQNLDTIDLPLIRRMGCQS